MREKPCRNIALVVEYDGTGYSGFQLQRNATSIQGELERAVAGLTQEPTRMRGAGRTDAGVHARGQVVAFLTTTALPCETIVKGVNSFLPMGIAVQKAYDVPLGFDPRRHARSRVYRYTILRRDRPSPLNERYAHRVAVGLDVEAMKMALALLHGSHDFAALGGSTGPGRSTVREVFSARLWQEDELLHIEIEANAFLPHQMRRTAGMLASVGAKRLSLEGVKAILEGHAGPEHRKLMPTLPPQGLCLMEVRYKDFPPHEREANKDLQR
ncbi:MAG: tRNA pseudouridine(38-40) synthase TruA [Chloroflexi bacterium]|nr:tRNA pseudouridine(38-40) synthase TruA [Chloroflexota bacterium]